MHKRRFRPRVDIPGGHNPACYHTARVRKLVVLSYLSFAVLSSCGYGLATKKLNGGEGQTIAMNPFVMDLRFAQQARKAVELEISLLSLDSSSNANKQNPQFDLGGQG